MAKRERKVEADEVVVAERAAVPTFTLRADRRGHLRALMAAMQEMPDGDMREAMSTLREFELYEEANR